MYLLNQGDVEVLVGPEQKKVASLSSGSMFGEMTMFGLPKRTATIRSMTPCSCYVAGHRIFFTLLQKYPVERKAFVALAQDRKKTLQERNYFSGCEDGAGASGREPWKSHSADSSPRADSKV